MRGQHGPTFGYGMGFQTAEFLSMAVPKQVRQSATGSQIVGGKTLRQARRGCALVIIPVLATALGSEAGQDGCMSAPGGAASGLLTAAISAAAPRDRAIRPHPLARQADLRFDDNGIFGRDRASSCHPLGRHLEQHCERGYAAHGIKRLLHFGRFWTSLPGHGAKYAAR